MQLLELSAPILDLWAFPGVIVFLYIGPIGRNHFYYSFRHHYQAAESSFPIDIGMPPRTTSPETQYVGRLLGVKAAAVIC